MFVKKLTVKDIPKHLIYIIKFSRLTSSIQDYKLKYFYKYVSYLTTLSNYADNKIHKNISCKY